MPSIFCILFLSPVEDSLLQRDFIYYYLPAPVFAYVIQRWRLQTRDVGYKGNLRVGVGEGGGVGSPENSS